MSGIAGIVHLDGAPVDRELLREMTAFLEFRGPDEQQVWSGQSVGLGHAMLRTTRESAAERQPFRLDGEVWITADARLDGRADLAKKLASGNEWAALAAAPASELILHAYHQWGDGCLEHLIGDFAFAIWDQPQRRLFCARDHLGVKPFYYAQVGRCLVFSNTLDCVRGFPGISEELNDLVIADYLMFDATIDLSATCYRDIQRLPPAHWLQWQPDTGEPVIRRYWQLPRDGCVRYKRPAEYVERYLGLLRTAVSDRLGTDRAGIFLSGGMDSSVVAAAASELLREQAPPRALQAYTSVVDRLAPDDERHYSGLVASALGIPITYLPVDDYGLFARWGQGSLRLPEPKTWPLAAVFFDQIERVGAHSRVLLTGDGGDQVMNRSFLHFAKLLRELRWWRLGRDTVKYVGTFRGIPGFGIRARWRRWRRGTSNAAPPFPVWLQPSMVERLDLRTRWEERWRPASAVHPWRPEAYQKLAGKLTVAAFEEQDPGTTRMTVEPRYPLLDLRLVLYLLAVPPIPWFVNKHLARVAMSGRLPEAILRRPKTPLRADPLVVRVASPGGDWIDRFVATPELERYINRAAVPPLAGDAAVERVWTNIRPICLNLWLQFRTRIAYNEVPSCRRNL